MQIIDNILAIRKLIATFKNSNKSIALVPTMGALHDGHASLIREAKNSADIVVVSIFVNPLQFNNQSDLINYPRDLERDTLFCKNLGVDIIFAPSEEMMYPNGLINATVNIKELDINLCGRARFGHFTGVCQVVTKLFNIITPNMVFFGRKDIQQLRIIETLVDDLNYNIKVIGCETLRAEDGLALSSRNVHLSVIERKQSVLVPKLLNFILSLIRNGLFDVNKLIQKGQEFLIKQQNIQLDYLEIVDYKNLQLLDTIHGKFIIATAIFIGKTRLIDHLIYEV